MASWHPLLCHILDVTACAERLLALRAVRLGAVARALQLSPVEAEAWLLLLVGLHDLGKATPPFQAQVPDRRAALVTLGFDFEDDHWSAHGELTCPLATAELVALGVERRFARQLARAVGGHHGVIPSMERTQSLTLGNGLVPREGGKARLWRESTSEIVRALCSCTGVTTTLRAPMRPDDDAPRHGVLADLAGLAAAADWLGSNADVFEYEAPPSSLLEYWSLARQRAAKCLDSMGWRPAPRAPRRTFHDLFGKPPWPLHSAIERLADTLEDSPSLIIVEAPMGEGKTEAALSLYDHLASRGANGLYFALPTQATANQIFGRVKRFLDDAYAGETHGLHLVHGDAGLNDAYARLKTEAFVRTRSVDGPARGRSGAVADAWFATSKRALLAPVGVGTVDQALLGVLGVKHGFVRLHGLAGKVLVVDEVHAYDTYTSELLARLLEWLCALGTTTVLLSATLPRSARTRLLQAYGATQTVAPAYPRITVARAGGATTATAFAPRRLAVDVRVEWHDERNLSRELVAATEQGGNVAVIVNTVARAQAMTCRLRAALPPEVPVRLLHARFPFSARLEREREAEAAYGPASTQRPRASVLVGTQVLEQSLDLDFDLMVTDVAPVDLVLQRAGRLHRHARDHRPHGMGSPVLWLLSPEHEDRDEGPSFGVSAYVYEEAALLASWLALRGLAVISLPTDIERLIEIVYGDGGPTQAPASTLARLAELDAKRKKDRAIAANTARERELPDPAQDMDPWNGFAEVFEDDDPTVHAKLRASTRLGDEAVSVIPVFEREPGTLVLVADEHVRLTAGAKEAPTRDLVLAFARQSLKIGRRGVTHALLRMPVPHAFEASGHLRFHRPLVLGSDRSTTVAGTRLRLDDDLGLIIGDLDDATLDQPT